MKIIIFILFSFLAKHCLAQFPDTGFQTFSITNAINHYQLTTGINAAIYNGTEHIGYPDFFEGHAYFETKEWQKGSIFYEGVEYPDVYLKYDLVTDKVIIRNPEGFALFLFSPRTEWFNLAKNKFIYLSKNETLSSSGFYQELVSGKMNLLAKRTKMIDEDISTGKLIKRFKVKDDYYVFIKGKYRLIKNESSIFNVTGEMKTQIKKYLKGKGIKYKNSTETALISIAEYYNSTSK